MTAQTLTTLSYPYKLPKWISALFVVLIPLAFWGIYHEAQTSGLHTRNGQPVSPWVMGFGLIVLLLSWLACVRILSLSVGDRQQLTLDEDSLILPKSPFNAAPFRIAYTAIESAEPHPLKPDIFVIKHRLTRLGTHTIQRISLPSREAYETVTGALVARIQIAQARGR
jgi:hypothetical protein